MALSLLQRSTSTPSTYILHPPNKERGPLVRALAQLGHPIPLIIQKHRPLKPNSASLSLSHYPQQHQHICLGHPYRQSVPLFQPAPLRCKASFSSSSSSFLSPPPKLSLHYSSFCISGALLHLSVWSTWKIPSRHSYYLYTLQIFLLVIFLRILVCLESIGCAVPRVAARRDQSAFETFYSQIDCVYREPLTATTSSSLSTSSHQLQKAEMLLKGEKYACEACVRGHRVTSCLHANRPLQHINKKVCRWFWTGGRTTSILTCDRVVPSLNVPIAEPCASLARLMYVATVVTRRTPKQRVHKMIFRVSFSWDIQA